MKINPKDTQYSIFSTVAANKYHSCVITGYCVDFLYFEEVVFPVLRKKGVVNIILLIDDFMLGQSIERLSSKGFNMSNGYSISPVKAKGVFHPKVIQFFGERSGLVSIGSGNPTWGGYGGNNEVWFSFQIESPDDVKAVNFVKVWNYIQSKVNNSQGYLKDKLNYIKKRADWLNKIQVSSGDTLVDLDGKQRFTILDNSDKGILTGLKQLLPDRQAEKINIHSPFFDETLSVLSLFEKYYNPKALNLFIQNERTVLPEKAVKRVPDKAVFYDVCKCSDKLGSEEKKYIHAKIFEFQFKNESWFLLGSANLSKSAFGTEKMNARNSEVCVLLESTKKTDYFGALGIRPNKQARIKGEITDYISEKGLLINGKPDHAGKIDVFINEINESSKEFLVYTNSVPQEDVSLALLNQSDKQFNLATYDVDEKEPGLVLMHFAKSDQKSRVNVGYLCNSGGDRISNLVPVINSTHLLISDPDPLRRKMRAKLAGIENGSKPLWSLFSLFKPEAFISEDEDNSKKKRAHSKKTRNVLDTDANTNKTNALECIQLLNKFLGLSFVDEFNDAREEDDVDQGSGTADDNHDSSQKIHQEGNLEAARRYSLKFFDKHLKLLKEYCDRKKMFPDFQMAFAIQAISTSLLTLYSWSLFYDIEEGYAEPLMPFEEDDYAPVQRILELTGRFYSERMRKCIKSKIQEQQGSVYVELFEKSAVRSAVSSIVLLYFLIASKDRHSIVDNDDLTMATCQVFNIIDFSERFLSPLSQADVKELIIKCSSSWELISGYNEKRLMEIHDTLWDMYHSQDSSQNIAMKIQDLNEQDIYYSRIYGYQYLRDLDIKQNMNCATYRMVLPGVDWDSDHKLYLSQSTKIFPNQNQPLFKTNISINNVVENLTSGINAK